MREVLVAEDDVELRRMLVEALARVGYRVREADSGRMLLERLWEKARADDRFDVIISDVRMPGGSGLDVLEGLRDDCEPGIGDTPIIFITGFGDDEVHRQASLLRAEIFDKPVDVDELRARVLQLAPVSRAT
jgi:CheY-like chemotaxis protein